MANDSIPVIRKLAYFDEESIGSGTQAEATIYEIGSKVENIIYDENDNLKQYLDTLSIDGSVKIQDWEDDRVLITHYEAAIPDNPQTQDDESKEKVQEIVQSDICSKDIIAVPIENNINEYEEWTFRAIVQYDKNKREIHLWLEKNNDPILGAGTRIPFLNLIDKNETNLILNNIEKDCEETTTADYLCWKLGNNETISNNNFQFNLVLKGTTDNIYSKFQFYDGNTSHRKDISFSGFINANIDDFIINEKLVELNRANNFGNYNILRHNKNLQKRNLTKNPLLDLIYPIGSIYLSLSPIDPKYLFGGTWKKHINKFLFGSGIHAPGYANVSNTNDEIGGSINIPSLNISNIKGKDDKGENIYYETGKKSLSIAPKDIKLAHAYQKTVAEGLGLTKNNTYANRLVVTSSVTNATEANKWRTEPNSTNIGTHSHTMPSDLKTTATTLNSSNNDFTLRNPNYITVNIWERIA